MECQEKINTLCNSFASYHILSTYKHDSFLTYLQELQELSLQSLEIGFLNSFFNCELPVIFYTQNI